MAYGRSHQVFVYTGAGANVPDDVVLVRIDPTVLAIPDEIFFGRLSFTSVYMELVNGYSTNVQP